MSRSKHTAKTQAESSNFISQMAASILSKAGVIDYCSTLLKALLEYWKTYVINKHLYANIWHNEHIQHVMIYMHLFLLL